MRLLGFVRPKGPAHGLLHRWLGILYLDDTLVKSHMR